MKLGFNIIISAPAPGLWKQTDIDNWTFNGVSQILKKKGLKKKKIKIKNFFDNSSLKENLKKYIFFGKGI